MSDRCPLTYVPLADGERFYSVAGLRALSPRLESLAPLEFTSEELRHEAAARSDKMSVGGVQPKVSAVLKPSEGRFELVTSGGRYLLKPENPLYPEVPANEDLTMRLAASAGVRVPPHGLLHTRDSGLCYFIQRFDRFGRNSKLAVEDFAQLLSLDRETKYDASMEQVASVVDRFCTFPVLEKVALLRLTLVVFLTGNEDMHLKNFSLITEQDGTRRLTPAYDLLNSTIALRKPSEELAIPLGGKKSRLHREHFLDYFGRERLGLNERVVMRVLDEVAAAQPSWDALLSRSFLNDTLRDRYAALLADRRNRLGI